MPGLLWTLVPALFVWLVLVNLIEYAITRVLWNKQWQGSPWTPTGLVVCRFVFGVSFPFSVLSLFLWYTLGSGGAIPQRAAFPVLILGSVLCAGVVSAFLRAWNRKRLRLAGTPVKQVPLLERLKHSPWKGGVTIWLLLPLWFILSPLFNLSPAWGIFLAYGSLIYAFVDTRRRKKGAPSGTIEMEDLPLLQEIRAVLKSYGRELRQVFVRTPSRLTSTAQVPLYTIDNPWGENLPRLIIPADNLQKLEPATYTAALSLHLARQPTLRAPSGAVGNPTSPLFVTGLTIVVMLLLLGFLFLMNGPRGPRLGSFTVVLAPFAVMVVMGLFRLYFSFSLVRAHRTAFEIWRRSDPSVERTIQDYVCAMAEHHAFHHRIADPDLVLHQVRLTSGLPVFIRKVTEQDAEPILAEAADHVRRWCRAEAEKEAREPA